MGFPAHKIDLIPHGIPSVPFDCANKDQLGVEGKKVLLTFGLLSPDKGIENVIEALPAILARHPDTVYIVLGATHPHVKANQGEMYRLGLENRAKKLGVDSAVFSITASSARKNSPSSFPPPISMSRPISTRNKPPRAPWPTPWDRAARSSPPPTGTPASFSPRDAASWSPGRTRPPSPRP